MIRNKMIEMFQYLEIVLNVLPSKWKYFKRSKDPLSNGSCLFTSTIGAISNKKLNRMTKK